MPGRDAIRLIGIKTTEPPSMDHDTEIRELAADTLATQIVLAEVLFRLRKIDPRIAKAVAQAFDDAREHRRKCRDPNERPWPHSCREGSEGCRGAPDHGCGPRQEAETWNLGGLGLIVSIGHSFSPMIFTTRAVSQTGVSSASSASSASTMRCGLK